MKIRTADGLKAHGDASVKVDTPFVSMSISKSER